MGRRPTARSRARSQAGDGPTVTWSMTRAVNLGQRSGASMRTVARPLAASSDSFTAITGGRQAHGRVRCAADPAEVRAAGRDATQHQPVSVALTQLALDRLDLADDDAAKPGGQRRDAGHLDAGVDQAVGGLLGREVEIDELEDPAVRDLHGDANCRRKRRSFSKKRRMSSMPYFNIATRSTPMPNAQPVTSSGS